MPELPIKQWIFTLVLFPLLVFLVQLYAARPGGYNPGLGIYPVTLIFSAIMSMPVLIIYYAVYDLLTRGRVDPSIIKIISILLAVAGITGTMKIIFPGAPLGNVFKIAYSTLAIIGGLLFDIDEKKKTRLRPQRKPIPGSRSLLPFKQIRVPQISLCTGFLHLVHVNIRTVTPQVDHTKQQFIFCY